MAWCEANRVDYVIGLARNARLVEEIAVEAHLGRGRGAADDGTGAPLQGLPLLALQLRSFPISESMGLHDSGDHGWRALRSRRRWRSGRRRFGL